MKRPLFYITGLLLPQLLAAQLFRNVSNLLPASAAINRNMDVRLIDLDKDNDLDIVMACEFCPNTILLNDGRGNFTNVSATNMPQPIRDSEDVAIADFNGDGNLDLVFCSEDDIVNGGRNVHEYYFGNGRGGFRNANIVLPDSEANAVIAQDINGDNKPDLIFGNNGAMTILINKGDTTGTFLNESNRVPTVTAITQDIAMADVDKDNDLDMFLGNENGVQLFINRGNGFFDDSTATRLPILSQLETRKVTFGDINKDGYPDVFLSNVAFRTLRNARDRLLLNDGTGKYIDVSATQLPNDNDHTLDAIFEDLDRDTHLDLVIVTAFGGRLKTFKNNGRGFFTDNTTETLGGDFRISGLGVAAGDLNGDGLRDLYFCNLARPDFPNTQDLMFFRNTPTAVQDKSGQIKVAIYPNPVQSNFFIDCPATIKKVDLVDTKGRIIQTLTVQKSQNETYSGQILPQKDRAGGIYFLKIETTEGVVSRQIQLN
jgi:hypothetical protein